MPGERYFSDGGGKRWPEEWEYPKNGGGESSSRLFMNPATVLFLLRPVPKSINKGTKAMPKPPQPLPEGSGGARGFHLGSK